MVYGVKGLSVHSVLVFDWPTRPGYVHDLNLDGLKSDGSHAFSHSCNIRSFWMISVSS